MSYQNDSSGSFNQPTVSVDWMTKRNRFVVRCANEGLDAAGWMMDFIVEARRIGESASFGSAEKMLRGKMPYDRLKIRD